ncbi:MAG: glycosyltransferase [Winogradskyella sp.]|uniref:ArnT family glycosyltransferase n=1 Tax=Winogradskyella sp. TaxID=1883156 RepID=UPI00180F86EB|nr:glycosyltransferase [Winogradskyella sp.]MBT8245477.1 glycosyltransferase [Winogradskyella sp.]NNK23079.1 glycosyltransferase [Winogradskyella sp.]
MIKTIEKHPVLSLLLFIILMFGFTIDAIPVSIMEGRNFISAREMLTDNNWILTTINGEPRYQKPPLPTWITAVFGYMFGIKNVLALRLPALLMIAVTGITTYFLSLQLTHDKIQSLISGFLVMTSFYVIGITIEGPWDIYAHGFILVALYQLLILLENKCIQLVKGLVIIAFIGASVLSKGPVSLYVLLLSFCIAYGFSFKYMSKYKFLYLKAFLLLIAGIGIGAIWYLYVRQADPEAFNKITSKETSNWSSYNVRPFYYYWSFFIQSGIWVIFAFVSLLYPYLKSKIIHKKAYKFTFLWTITGVILLSLIPEKKSRYLMPVLIPLAINMGFYVNYLIKEFKNLTSKKEIFPVYLQFGLIAVIAILYPFSGFILKPYLSGIVLVRFLIASVLMITIGYLILKHLKTKHIKNSFYLTLTFMLCVGIFIIPLVKLQKQSDYKGLESFNPSNTALYSINTLAPEVIYNYGKKIPSLGTSEDFIIPSDTTFYLLTSKSTLENSYLKSLNSQFIGKYDLNTAEKDKRGYKNRLVNYLFKISK